MVGLFKFEMVALEDSSVTQGQKGFADRANKEVWNRVNKEELAIRDAVGESSQRQYHCKGNIDGNIDGNFKGDGKGNIKVVLSVTGGAIMTLL